MTWLLAAATVTCWVVAGFKFHALLADRSRSSVIRDTAVCVAALAGVFTLLLPPVIAIIDSFSANLALLLNSLLGIVSITAFQCRLIAIGHPAAVRRWWIGCVFLDAVRAALFIAAPSRIHRVEMIDFAVNYTRYPVLTVFDVLRLAWFTILFANIWRMCRALARREPNRSTRWGLRLFTYVGMTGLGYVGYEVAYLAARFSGHPLPGTERTVGTMILASIILLVGLSTAAVRGEPRLSAALACRRIRPLWECVAASRIGGTLDDPVLTPAQRLIRKRQEISDGLARISDHYDQALWLEVYQGARKAGHSLAKSRARADDATILNAFLAEQRGDAARPVVHCVPGGADQDNLIWQSAVSKALRALTGATPARSAPVARPRPRRVGIRPKAGRGRQENA